ncbi:MAG: histidinol-phosphate transaminase [Proteobacteria bacterium]|nr:histidinol-phosphate transaminase [Pseudomonadota bacterium]
MSGLSPVELARTAVRELEPYSSARSEAAEAGVYLDANESPWPPEMNPDYAAVVEAMHRYPEPQPHGLIEQFSDLYGVPGESIFVGRGTDDAIDALFRVFCEAQVDRVIVCPPTYGMYEVSAAIQGASVVKVPLIADSGFQPDIASIAAAAGERTKLAFLCSPNNPTGNPVDRDAVIELCQSLSAVVVVDEAYVEFCPQASVTDLLGRFDNLVVLRTMSKAWALAGARCGVALGHPDVIELLHRVRAPYPLSRPAVTLVENALSPQGRRYCSERIKRLITAREDLARQLVARGDVEFIYPSEANFLLVKVHDVNTWLGASRHAGILIRDRSGVVPGCVRITVGSPEQNAALLAAVTEAV